MTGVRAAVVTISDSSAAGGRQDLSGPSLAARIEALGWTLVERRLVADDIASIASVIVSLTGSNAVNLIVTTGGTGIAPRDVTPEAIRPLAPRELPGFGERMRAEGLKKTPLAPLSRSFAAVRGETLIVCVPGSPRGALDSLNAVAPLIPHAVALLAGHTTHEPPAPDAKLKA